MAKIEEQSGKLPNQEASMSVSEAALLSEFSSKWERVRKSGEMSMQRIVWHAFFEYSCRYLTEEHIHNDLRIFL